MTRYLEDYHVGETDEYGAYTVTEEEIVCFAEQYDPQDIHTDPDIAEESQHNGLIASGWQTACIAMRLAVDHGYLDELAIVGGVGVENLQWLHPVRPGDTLWVSEEIVSCQPSESNPDQGILKVDVQVFNQDDVTVLSMVWVDIVQRTDGTET